MNFLGIYILEYGNLMDDDMICFNVDEICWWVACRYWSMGNSVILDMNMAMMVFGNNYDRMDSIYNRVLWIMVYDY